MPNVPNNYAEIVKTKRLARGWTQEELADRLGMTNVTISRWEKGRVQPATVFWEKFLNVIGEREETKKRAKMPTLHEAVDFMGDGLGVRAMVEGERLTFGHLANPAFATEVSKIDPLPHQRIAVYEHMLKQ